MLSNLTWSPLRKATYSSLQRLYLPVKTVWRMRVGIDSPVSPLSSILKKWTSILAFSTDLSRIQAVSCMQKIGLRLQKND